MPPITIWVTDYFISQRVCAALKTGLPDANLAFAGSATDEQIAATPIHIGYGIRDKMDEVVKRAEDAGKHWFILDHGYFGRHHFTGFYRIAYKGTQSVYDEKIQGENTTDIAPWRETKNRMALICPPTGFVNKFFSIDEAQWIDVAIAQAKSYGLIPEIRHKKDAEKEELVSALSRAAAVITFNSSVAWQALGLGIPAFSDITRSTLGSWHGKKGSENLAALKSYSREKLFRFMAASQLTLLEIQQGKILNILRRYADSK